MRIRRGFRPNLLPSARSLSAWALLFALPLLTGGLDFHPHGEPPGGASLLSGETYSPEAIHPDQPHHFEAGTTAQRPVCPACLFQAATSGGHLTAFAGVTPAVLSGRIAEVEGPDLARGRALHHPSRGPPTPSSLT
jgi:hypothetical protein